ncbi:DUF371 domain-containing protein [Halorubrum ezzemoulense]|uniref:DUF371 domain-containing protein n=1 Tax=Halorubrum ezzemoulense TaxID=337243 RepID=UPI00232E2DFA|nr:DUF371 domain-containing protein [Halorubrum ezzemoulense]MDB2270019.1 DUF371 domain-containing protein [Halorubrum ezzemoulense]
MSDADAPSEPAAGDALDDGERDVDDTRVEVVRATGHEHVSAEHASTFELTTDDWLTPAGDCIVGVEADRSPRDFSAEFREACRDADATIEATLVVDAGDDETFEQTITGRGDPDLALLDDRSMVGRTSDYTDDERTILVDGDGAAADLDRDLVAALADGADLTLRLEVEPAE